MRVCPRRVGSWRLATEMAARGGCLSASLLTRSRRSRRNVPHVEFATLSRVAPVSTHLT